MTERLTLDTNLLHELWKDRDKRRLVEQILALDDVELAVTATVHEDVPHGPLVARLGELSQLGITETPRLARVGAWVLEWICSVARSSSTFSTSFRPI